MSKMWGYALSSFWVGVVLLWLWIVRPNFIVLEDGREECSNSTTEDQEGNG